MATYSFIITSKSYIWIFSDEFSTLRSVRSHLTDTSLQHNYSNISPVAHGGHSTSPLTSQNGHGGHSTSPLTSQHGHGPASIVSSSMSAVSGGSTRAEPATLHRQEVNGGQQMRGVDTSNGGYAPPVPTSLPPMENPPKSPASERQRKRDRERSLAEEVRRSKLSEVSDLTRLAGPLTEDAVVKTLQARFYNQKYQV